MCFGFFGGSARPSDLDVGAVRALLGDVQGDIELRLDATTGLAATANEKTMLSLGNLDGDGDLILFFFNEILNSSDDLLDDDTVTLEFDSRFVTFCARELDHSRSATVGRTTGIRNDLTDVGTYKR